MAGETVFADYVTVAAYLDANIAPAFRSSVIMPNLMHVQNFQGKSDSIKLRKRGTVTATAGAEATDHALSQYQESSPNTLVAGEVKVYLEISDKAIKFAQADVDELVAECGRALAQKFDIDSLALLDALHGGTQVGTSGSDCTPGILLQASFTVRAANIASPLVYALNPVQVYDVQDDLLTTTASAWTNLQLLSLLNGQPPASNGYVGAFLGIPVFETTNTESVNSNADWAGGCWAPQFALAAAFAGDVQTRIGYNIKKGVTEVGCSLWYDVKEYQDAAGVSIETDQ